MPIFRVTMSRNEFNEYLVVASTREAAGAAAVACLSAGNEDNENVIRVNSDVSVSTSTASASRADWEQAVKQDK